MKKFIYSVSVALCFFLMACKKTDVAATYLMATDFQLKYAPKEQKLVVNGAAGGTVTGAKGTTLVFPPASFINKNGEAETGMVSLSLTELLDKRDIIFSGVFTEANGQLLVSGGELLIHAKDKNGEDLKINRQLPGGANQGIRVEVPNVMKAGGDMRLFVRQERQGGNQSNDNPMTWTPAPYAPFGNGANSYLFNLPDFSWVNIDRFYNDPRPKTTVTCSPVFKDDNNVSNLEVMIVFKDVSTVCPIPFRPSLQLFESYHDAVPVGSGVIVVMIGKDSGGHIQFGKKDVVVSGNMHLDMEIKKTTQSELDSFLATLQ
jgi:hypothetical protein